jgi:hypothetical protein
MAIKVFSFHVGLKLCRQILKMRNSRPQQQPAHAALIHGDGFGIEKASLETFQRHILPPIFE